MLASGKCRDGSEQRKDSSEPVSASQIPADPEHQECPRHMQRRHGVASERQRERDNFGLRTCKGSKGVAMNKITVAKQHEWATGRKQVVTKHAYIQCNGENHYDPPRRARLPNGRLERSEKSRNSCPRSTGRRHT